MQTEKNILTLPPKKYRRRSSFRDIGVLKQIGEKLDSKEMLRGCKALENVLQDIDGLQQDRDRLLRRIAHLEKKHRSLQHVLKATQCANGADRPKYIPRPALEATAT